MLEGKCKLLPVPKHPLQVFCFSEMCW